MTNSASGGEHVRVVAVLTCALVLAQGCASHRRPSFQERQAGSTSLSGTTVEASDPALAAALLRLRLVESPALHRAAAGEYKRLGILDAAFDQLTAATRLNSRDAAAYDGRARIWRDWGFPELGMGDATRAVYFAPRSAAAHNTLGTLLAGVGRIEEARREFALAVALDPHASFARANLCYLDAKLAGGDATAVPVECREPVALNRAK